MNLYKNLLDSLYQNYILNLQYQEGIQAQKNRMHLKDYNYSFRVYTLNLGRRMGASTAIKDFIKNNSDLNFIIINTSSDFNYNFKDLKVPNVKLCTSLHSLHGSLASADIIFFDNFNIMKKDRIFKELDDEVLQRLNASNKSQVYIRLG